MYMGAGASSSDFGLETCVLSAEAKQLKDEADTSVKHNDYFEAEVKYSEALVLEPNSALLWGLRAAVRHEINEFGQALNDSLTCIALAPTSFFGYYYAGKSAKSLKKEHLANDFFQRAIALNPSAPPIVKAAKEMEKIVANLPRGATNNVISWTNGKDPSILGHRLQTNGRSRAGGGSTGGLYPKMVAGLRGHYITDVGCGMSHCIAVSAIGDCFCWGQNKQGQCGVGVSSDEPITYPVIIPVLIGLKVLHVSCGAGHSVCTTEAAGVFFFISVLIWIFPHCFPGGLVIPVWRAAGIVKILLIFAPSIIVAVAFILIVIAAVSIRSSIHFLVSTIAVGDLHPGPQG